MEPLPYEKKRILREKKELHIVQCVAILERFQLIHGGYLPTIRMTMRSFSLGFPDACELREQYAKYYGLTVN